MNNNRGNNRRRGRGNNNGRPQGGGQQINRIDSRARGNAPQMLEKYRKLAHDAHLNGDRVTAEYYLQFADHYFRVIADTRQRLEEARVRREDRPGDNSEPYRDDADEGSEFSMESDFPTFDQPPVYTRREREDRPAEGRGPDSRRREERPARDQRDDGARDDSGDDGDESNARGNNIGEQAEGGEAGNPYEPAENPFLRENRGTRGLRPRREDRRPRREEKDSVPRGDGDAADAGVAQPAMSPAGLDPASLPPSISSGRKDADGGDPAPSPRRRARRKPSADDAGEALESVG